MAWFSVDVQITAEGVIRTDGFSEIPSISITQGFPATEHELTAA
jgi:hypothetical protein